MTFGEARERVRPYTCLSDARLRGLWDAAQAVEHEGVAGDLVECGCYKGGGAAMLGLAATSSRTLWLFDSFRGMPEPTANDPRHAWRFVGCTCGPLGAVKANIAACGLASGVEYVEGWYRDTLPCPRVERVAVLHVDCDWYESVRECLEAFWPVLAPGAVVQIDDYGHWAGARKAVDEFLDARQRGTEMTVLDYTGRQFRKGVAP